MNQTRFTPDLDLDGLSADEAFAILGNEIRLKVIRVLWRADAAHEYDDGSDIAETMSYSELQKAVDVLVLSLALIPPDGEGLEPRFCGRWLHVAERI